jgi:hypothetical protein
MTMPTSTLTHEQTLGPLTADQRQAIMRHATTMTASARRTFRRLLMLNQTHGLDTNSIARTAAQAHEHDSGL